MVELVLEYARHLFLAQANCPSPFRRGRPCFLDCDAREASFTQGTSRSTSQKVVGQLPFLWMVETSRMSATMTPQLTKPFSNAPEYSAIMQTMQNYIDGGRTGKSDIMRPSFHPAATIVGYCGGTLLTGPIQQLFDWIDANGPAPNVEPNLASIEDLETVAV